MDISAYVYPPLIVLSSLIIAATVKYVLKRLAEKSRDTETKIDDILLASVEKPLVLLIVAIGLYYAAHTVPVLRQFMQAYDTDFVYRSFIFTIFGTWVVAVLVDRIIKEYGYQMAKETKGDFDDRLIALADMSARYIIWAMGILIALKGIGLEITPLLAGMGIAGLAFALAAQNLIANIFGGITLTVDRPFRVGDRIKIGDVYGDVFEIKPRYTKIRTLDNIIVTMPNSKLIDTQIYNYAYPDTSIRLRLPVSVSYDSDPEKVRKVLLGVIGSIPLSLKKPSPDIRFLEYAASSLNFEAWFWIANYADREAVIDDFNRKVYRAFRKEKIEMPYPQMDVHIRK